MNINKLPALTLALAALTLASTAQAKLPESDISFAKGSYCGNYTGNLLDGRILSVYTGAHQTIVINTDDAYVASVMDAKGNLLEDIGYESWDYDTKYKGKHDIRVISDGVASVKVCVY